MGLPDSLLSRFDLLFIVLDNIDTELDRQLADHILGSHQYRRPGQDMTPEPLNADMHLHSTFNEVLGNDVKSMCQITESAQTNAPELMNEDEASSIWRIQHRISPQGPNRCSGLSSGDANLLPPKDAVLHSDFVRKYVNFARHQVEPSLSDEARESIANAYADLRAKADDRTLPVTARCLESLIRIATAHAKVRLSPLVDRRDCQAALKFLSFALYGDVQLEDDISESKLISTQMKLRNDVVVETASKRPRIDPHNTTIGRMSANLIHSGPHSCIEPKRHKIMVDAYTGLASTHEIQEKVHITELLLAANSLITKRDAPFQIAEVEVILRKLQSENRLMYDETNRDIHFL